MKKISLIFCLTIIITAFGCGAGSNSETNEKETVIKEQEEQIAEEAKKEAETAKEQAIETEKEVEKLLEEI